MSEIKEVVWKTIDIKIGDLTRFLNMGNFQPGKFHLVQSTTSPFTITVVYVESETDIPDYNKLLRAFEPIKELARTVTETKKQQEKMPNAKD